MTKTFLRLYLSKDPKNQNSSYIRYNIRPLVMDHNVHTVIIYDYELEPKTIYLTPIILNKLNISRRDKIKCCKKKNIFNI